MVNKQTGCHVRLLYRQVSEHRFARYGGYPQLHIIVLREMISDSDQPSSYKTIRAPTGVLRIHGTTKFLLEMAEWRGKVEAVVLNLEAQISIPMCGWNGFRCGILIQTRRTWNSVPEQISEENKRIVVC